MTSAQPVNVLITIPLDETLQHQLQAVSPRLRLIHIPAQKAEDVPAEIWERCDVLYTANVLPAPEQAASLKWIQFHYAGIDHALDAPILQKPGLRVTTLSGAAASQMAEHVLTMLLALGHNLPDVLKAQRAAEWPEDRWQRFLPHELRDSVVGILGYGSIGRQVARLLHPFGATVLAAKYNAMDPVDHGYTPPGQGDPGGDYARRIYPYQALKSMARECNALVVAAPLTTQTRGLVGHEVLQALRPGAFLVDVSRGGIVDLNALLAALRSGQLGGAALDVFPQEPLPASHPLWRQENVIITPHISGNSRRYTERAMALFAENLRRFLAGEPLYNLFDPEKGY